MEELVKEEKIPIIEQDAILQRKILDLIIEHFIKTGKVLSAITFKYDQKELNEKRLNIKGWSRSWKWPKEKKVKRLVKASTTTFNEDGS